MPKVWNKRDWCVPPDAVYVGRPTKWDNPFKIGPDANGTVWTREQVVQLYRSWLDTNEPALIAEAKRELKGKDLVCWCAPLPCHADVLLELANAEGSATHD